MSASMLPTLALYDVIDERARQDAKWGEQNHDPPIWLAILGEEYGELCQAVLQPDGRGIVTTWPVDQPDAMAAIRAEAIHVAAVALAMVECLDRQARAPLAPSTPPIVRRGVGRVVHQSVRPDLELAEEQQDG